MLDIRSIPCNDAFLVAKLQTVTATCKVSIMQVASHSFLRVLFLHIPHMGKIADQKIRCQSESQGNPFNDVPRHAAILGQKHHPRG